MKFGSIMTDRIKENDNRGCEAKGSGIIIEIMGGLGSSCSSNLFVGGRALQLVS